MAFWQKKLLRYALSRTGLLDDKAIDLANLDLQWGKRNTVELREVGLNISRITTLVQLPPSLRVETARVLSLKLTVPADIYQSPIVVEIDGVQLDLRLVESEDSEAKARNNRSPFQAADKVPSHRKTHRRLRSPPPYDPGGAGPDADDSSHIPTTEDIARSFLHDEPLQERRDIEASLAANQKSLEDSETSESSHGSEVGTGNGIGLPGFLTGFLQGIVDRLQVRIGNVSVTLETELAGDDGEDRFAKLVLSAKEGSVGSVEQDVDNSNVEGAAHTGMRHVKLLNIALDLQTELNAVSRLSDMTSLPSPSLSKTSVQSSPRSRRTQPEDPVEEQYPAPERPSTSSTDKSFGSVTSKAPSGRTATSSAGLMHESMMTSDEDRFANAGEDEAHLTSYGDDGILPGDDNISWTSRQSRQSHNSSQNRKMWESMESQYDMEDSLNMRYEETDTLGQPHNQERSSVSNAAPRAPSPFTRSPRSPGSWPALEESQVFRPYQSPGSWPAVDQSQHNAPQPLVPYPPSSDGSRSRHSQPSPASWPANVEEDASSSVHLGSTIAARSNTTSSQGTSEIVEDAVDNKQAALVQADQTEPHIPSPQSSYHGDSEDLAASRMFSHEEAESMYMSAMTGGLGDASFADRPIPGGWGSDGSPSERSISPESQRRDLKHMPTILDEDLDATPDDLEADQGPATPRAQTPVNTSTSSFKPLEPIMDTKQILHIDAISLWLPSSLNKTEAGSEQPKPASSSHKRGLSASFAPTELPGAFSVYSEQSRAQRGAGSSFYHSQVKAEPQSASELKEHPKKQRIDLSIATASGQLDLAHGLVMFDLLRKASEALQPRMPPAQPATVEPQHKSVNIDVNLNVKSIRLAFSDAIGGSAVETLPEGRLLAMVCDDLAFKSSDDEVKLQIQRFGMFIGEDKLLGFSRDRDLNASRMLLPDSPDISVLVNTSLMTISSQPIYQIDIETLPVALHVDLPNCDKVFGEFGGISGMLELGNSALAEKAATSSPRHSKQSKGVRFGDEVTSVPSGPEYKINATVNGAHVVLKGSTCSIAMKTSTIRAVSREHRASATISLVSLSGPHTHADGPEPSRIELSTIRVDYGFTPSDKHIERLLTILTPSTDQYAEADDILLDALIRQRKKGSLIQLTVDQLQLEVRDKRCVTVLAALGEEFAKLSAVASYLPEDDRPGLLSLLRLKQVITRIPVNERFGEAHLKLEELNIAHVGWPALLAVALGDVSLQSSSGKELIHSLVPFEAAEPLPALRARMVGDEVEPSLQVKIYNVCIEYYVSVLLALTGMDNPLDPQEVVADLVRSVADLARFQPTTNNATETPQLKTESSSFDKKTKVSLFVRDCAIGLNSETLDSKCLLLLCDARTSTTIPPATDHFQCELQLRKAALFLADRAIAPMGLARARGAPRNMATNDRLTTQLSYQGFISIVSIVSLSIKVFVKFDPVEIDQSVEVELSNELVLLESCADSTQTLFAVLGSLVPPTPPSKQQKYLTDPIPVTNLMESFSGDAYAKPESDVQREMLFDVEQGENEDTDDFPSPLLDDETEQLLLDSQMEGSLYGPISGIIGDDREDAPADGEDEFKGTVESMLEEEDPFEMPDLNIDRPISDDALRRDLEKQFQPVISNEVVDLGVFEVCDLGYDALSGGDFVLGTGQRFNTPETRRSNKLQSDAHVEFPFKLRVRNLHVIWNLHDGYDWQRTREGITQAVEDVETRMEERRARRRRSDPEPQEEVSEIGDFLFNSIYIGVPGNDDAQELRRQINRGIDDLASETESIPVSGMSRPTSHSASIKTRLRPPRRLKLERSKKHKIVFELKGVCADVLLFPPQSRETQNLIDIRIRDIEVLDNVPTSTWRKFLTYHETPDQPREMSRPMAHVNIEMVRTIKDFAATELLMRVELLPLRLHVDQDALDFITRFFEFKDPQIIPLDSGAEPVFIQRLDVETVDLCLDYKPKTIDYGGLRSGHTTEFMNFVILDTAPIRLKRAIVHGLRGFEPLHSTLNNIWMPDVQRHQLPGILGSLAPVRHLTNLGSGMRDVVAIPIREYQKDGRIVRSVQKGAFHFGKTTTSELARLGAKVATGTHTLLQGAERFLSSDPASPAGHHSDAEADDDAPEQRAVSAYANQPLGVFSGLRSARRYLEHDLLTARDALIAVQGEALDSSSPAGAAAAVARHAPTVILRPVIGASRAVGTALMGVGNQIDKANLKKIDDKYKRT
ncbi:hypothetical protein K431DRAFT_347128 [Polychaeton citri CBS 116435]|uniref:Autophagy-related protein 2 n=1 Tax=Polychaeton citri CBS 116435 TaxID=1314669 RepID=A0A9P4Q623_9PEZI|nr:hypothetical protein K431DRAFT_347128 [Polychaeton citri CBS 116435]